MRDDSFRVREGFFPPPEVHADPLAESLREDDESLLQAENPPPLRHPLRAAEAVQALGLDSACPDPVLTNNRKEYKRLLLMRSSGVVQFAR